MTTSWLAKQGISRQLVNQYKKSRWIESIGIGAFKRVGDTVTWLGGVYALQKQADIPLHVGGLTALSLQSSTHYLRFRESVQLFGQTKKTFHNGFKNIHGRVR